MRKPKRGGLLLRLELFCRAEPLQRPRLGAAHHVYQPKDNQKALFEEMWPYTPVLNGNPLNEPVIIDMVFAFSRGDPKFNHFKGDYPTAPCFGDEDNLRKAVNDALVHCRLISDDRLVVGGSTFKIFDKENRVRIKIWRTLCESPTPTSSTDSFLT